MTAIFEYCVKDHPECKPPKDQYDYCEPSDIEWWLNNMAERGWELVSYARGQTPMVAQGFWIFRRAVTP